MFDYIQTQNKFVARQKTLLTLEKTQKNFLNPKKSFLGIFKIHAEKLIIIITNFYFI